MNSEERVKAQKEIVEEIGRFFDKKGLQPIAGRVLGLLMTMDKEQFTFDEITQELQISKSSASNVLRNLEIRGDIEYTTIPGDRKRYYHIKRQNVFEMFDEFEKEMRTMVKTMERIIELKADKESKNSIFFKELIKFVTISLENLQLLKEQYKKA